MKSLSHSDRAAAAAGQAGRGERQALRRQAARPQPSARTCTSSKRTRRRDLREHSCGARPPRRRRAARRRDCPRSAPSTSRRSGPPGLWPPFPGAHAPPRRLLRDQSEAPAVHRLCSASIPTGLGASRPRHTVRQDPAHRALKALIPECLSSDELPAPKPRIPALAALTHSLSGRHTHYCPLLGLHVITSPTIRLCCHRISGPRPAVEPAPFLPNHWVTAAQPAARRSALHIVGVQCVASNLGPAQSKPSGCAR